MLLDTSLEPRPAARRWLQRGILTCLVTALVALASGAALAAQAKPGHGKKKGHAKSEKADKPGKPAKPAGAPKVSLAPTVIAKAGPTDKGSRAKLARQTWSHLTGALFSEFLARNPDRAFERAWPGNPARALGTFGSAATLRWHDALVSARLELAQLAAGDMPREARAQCEALADWLEAELLVLDGLCPSTSDPAGYVQRVSRTLAAANAADWLPPEQRQAEIALLLQQLPAYFRDARVGLVDLAPQSIDQALLDLDDLEELLVELEQHRPKAPEQKAPKAKKAAAPQGSAPAGPPAPAPETALATLTGFRAWLLELRPKAGGRPPGLNADEWQRLARLRTGTAWTTGEIKTRGLRELAQLDLAARIERAGSRSASDAQAPTTLATAAAASAVQLSKAAHLLGSRPGAREAEFVLETSPRMRPELAWLGPGDAPRIVLAEPHGSWAAARTVAHDQRLQSAPRAIGVCYGLAGEAFFAQQSRACRSAAVLLLDNHPQQAGFGLFALDWASRVDWVENPFRADEDVLLEFDLLRGLEAARLVAALELHAEGLSPEEAALGFQRRTGVDPETARIEALAAARDPRRGLGYLGLTELRGFEGRLAELTGKRRGLRLSLLLSSRHPDLRPADLKTDERATAAVAKKKGSATRALENPGQPQHEHPRSR